MIFRPRWVAAVLSLTAVAGGVAVAETGHTSQASAAGTVGSASVLASKSAAPLAAPHLDPSLVANLRQATGALALTGPAAARTLPINIDAARQALVTTEGLQVVAAPGTDGEVCAMPVIPVSGGSATKPTSEAAPSCTDAGDFNANGVSTTLGSPPSVWVAGLVPDGVTSVTLTLADGSVENGPVTNNAFAIHSTQATRSLSFKGPAGTAVVAAKSYTG